MPRNEQPRSLDFSLTCGVWFQIFGAIEVFDENLGGRLPKRCARRVMAHGHYSRG